MVVAIKPPLVPVMVKVDVPRAEFLFVLTVKIELDVPLALTVTGFELKLALVNLGSPLTLRLTLPLKPPDEVMEIVSLPLCPGLAMVRVADWAERLKLPVVEAAFTVTDTLV